MVAIPRRLGLSDILPALDAPTLRNARMACLASLFVSPMLTLADTVTIFDALKARGLTLCADTTRPKRGETLREAGPVELTFLIVTAFYYFDECYSRRFGRADREIQGR